MNEAAPIDRSAGRRTNRPTDMRYMNCWTGIVGRGGGGGGGTSFDLIRNSVNS